MTEKTQVSARVDKTLSDALDEIARQRRLTTGEDLRKADLIREALERYVAKNLNKPQG